MNPGSPLFVDAHVHLHECFDLAVFLGAAVRNVARAADSTGHPGATGVLLLTEGAREDGFARLRTARAVGPLWVVEPLPEPEAVRVREDGVPRLLVVAGQQIVTASGVEVLGLLGGQRVPDGRDLESTIAMIRDTGAIPVLPWGFGKWTLRRGALVAHLLQSSAHPPFVGDNGGRAAVGGRPRLLREAQERGIVNLPGSDPLPLAGHETRAGSCGFLADCSLDDAPVAALREWLLALRTQPPVYGRPRRLDRFVRDQISMQVVKRMRGRP